MHDREGQAGVYTPAIDVDRTRAALTVIAPFLGSEELHIFAQRVQQRDSRLQR
jgi:hypothetical protein